jgi:hypothetical protein
MYQWKKGMNLPFRGIMILMIKNSRIPFHFRSEKDMWQSGNLMVGVRTNIKARKTIFNIEMMYPSKMIP